MHLFHTHTQLQSRFVDHQSKSNLKKKHVTREEIKGNTILFLSYFVWMTDWRKSNFGKRKTDNASLYRYCTREKDQIIHHVQHFFDGPPITVRLFPKRVPPVDP